MAVSATWTKSLSIGACAAILVMAVHPAAAQTVSGKAASEKGAAWAGLPDWSGVWQMVGGTVLDHLPDPAPVGQAGPCGPFFLSLIHI